MTPQQAPKNDSQTTPPPNDGTGFGGPDFYDRAYGPISGNLPGLPEPDDAGGS